jgi:hypothetical protein
VKRNGIPKRFQLLGHVITVRIVPKSRWKHGKSCVGIWEPDKFLISIVSGQPSTAMTQTFCHELTHACLDMMSHKLSNDEKFVDTYAHLLNNALTTFEE